MWALMAAPLVFSGDMAKLDEFTLNVLNNFEVIDINQDALGEQAQPVVKTDDTLVLVKSLENGSTAVGLFNLAGTSRDVTVQWETLGISGPQRLRDVWRQKEVGEFDKAFSVRLDRHGVVLIVLRA